VSAGFQLSGVRGADSEEYAYMDIKANWDRLKAHRGRLTDKEIQGLAEVLFHDREDWLEEKLRSRDEAALAFELLGCLGQKGSRKACEILLSQLEVRDEVLQIATSEALKRCPPYLVLAPLAGIMKRQNHSSAKAGEIMLSFGQEGMDLLWEQWFDDDMPVRLKMQIIQLLGEAGGNRLEYLAFLAFLSEDEELVRAALKIAEKMNAASLWGNVTECLKSPSWRVRGKAIQVLREWCEKRALSYLRDMGQDDDPWVEEERQRALAELA
jgi:HEAT repeat protein